MAGETEEFTPNLEGLQESLDASRIESSQSLNDFLASTDLPAKPVAIDIYKNSVGNPVKGSNPGLNFTSAEAFAQANLKEQAGKTADPYTNMRPFTYSGDSDGANFDRYYGTKAYNALGFSPYRDNDALYNQKMTFGDQFVRAASQWDNLMATGFMSGVKAWSTIFTDPLAPDLDSARDMKRATSIGMSSAGGIGGAVTNTFLNSAYSIGIGLEFLAEEAALAAATVFTGGMAGEVTLPAMAARGGMLGRQLTKLGELGAKVGGKVDKFGDAVKGFEKAKDFSKVAAETAGGATVNSAREYFAKFASGAFDMANPFESTVTALKSSRYANDLAKTVGTAGAFADDIIRIKTAASEAQLEGGMVKLDANERLIQQYRELHGKDPEGEDLREIENLSSVEARRAVFWNYPAIMTSNKLLFSTILYPLNKVTGRASSRILENIIAEGGMKAGVTDPFIAASKTTGAQIKAAAKSFAKPKIYGSYGMAYLKGNVGEGIQENLQEAISQGAIEHALAVQKDPGMGAYRGYMGYLMAGLKDQISVEGAETFLSGFAMGAFTQPIMTAPSWALSKGAERFGNKEAREKAKKERDEATARDVEVLNDLANNDILYWAKNLITSVKNSQLSKEITESAAAGDVKGSKDAKFRLEFNHIETAVRTGKFEDLMDRLADYKNLTPKEALEAFQRYGIGINTEAEASAALNQIDGAIERARSIKAQYEKVAQDFPNPYNLSGINPDIKEYSAILSAQRAWTEAQNNLVFAQSEFEEYSSRLEKMTAAFSSLASGIAKSDAQSLLAVTSLPSLGREVATLEQEIKALGELEGQAKIKKQKEKTKDLLTNFGESIIAAQQKIKDENITDYFEKQKVYQESKKEFQKYLTYLAKKNDTILFNSKADEAFTLLTDSLEMRDEQHRLADSINVLNNPKGFLTLQKRLADAFQDERAERESIIENSIGQMQTMVDENTFIQALGKMGVKIPEDFLAEYKVALNTKKGLPTPTHFIDPSTQSDITVASNPQKFAEAMSIWEGFSEWMKLNHELKDPEPVLTPEELLKRAVADKEALAKYDNYDQGLRENLTAMYEQAKEDKDIPEDESLATYLRTNPRALIEITISEGYKNKAVADALAAEAAKKKKDEGIPLGTEVNPEARVILNTLGYSNTQIKDLSREERARIIRDGIPVEEYTPLVSDIEDERQKDLKFYTPHNLKQEIEDIKALKVDVPKVTVKYKDNPGKWQTERDAELKALSINSNIKPKIFTAVALAGGFTANGENYTVEKVEGYKMKAIRNRNTGEVLGHLQGSEWHEYSEETLSEEKFLELLENLEVEKINKDIEDRINAKYNAKYIEEDSINKDYEGKIVYMTPGAGKSELAKTDKNIIDGDTVILDTAQALEPGFKIDPELPIYKNIGKAIDAVGRERLYNEAYKQMRSLATTGKTVLIGSVGLMKVADIIMTQINPELVRGSETYDQMKEIEEINKINKLTIAIDDYASEVLKRSIVELLGTPRDTQVDETQISEPTIEDINQNRTINNLQIAQERGYDALYKNNRYTITKVDENSVTLKAIDGTTLEVKPEEITAITETENVVVTPEETEAFKANETVLSIGKFKVDLEADDLEAAIKKIKDNIC